MASDVGAPNAEFARLVPAPRVQRVADALRANNFEVVVAGSGDEARHAVLDLLPVGAEVFNATSRTLDATGIAEAIERSGRYKAVRPELMALIAEGRQDEMRRLGAAPDVVVGSVHAVTEAGQILVASAGGSQLGPYASGAGRVVWVVGTQKLVLDLDEGFRRIEQYAWPLEDARAREVYGVPSAINKVLVVNREAVPGRTTVVLVEEVLGF